MSGPFFLENVTVTTGGLRRGRLSGTTAIAGAPQVPTARLVQLFEREFSTQMFFRASKIVAEVISDAAGVWSVEQLDQTKRYAAIAYDHTGQYDPVIKINLIPTVD